MLSGIQSANKKYETWSNGAWLIDSGVEGLLVSSIAERLSSTLDEHESLMMEVPFNNILKWADARRTLDGPARNLTGQTSYGEGKVVCVIEVKRAWVRGRCLADMSSAKRWGGDS